MPTKTAPQIQINTRVDEEVLARLDEVCESQDRSRAWVLKEALTEFLDRHTAVATKTGEVV